MGLDSLFQITQHYTDAATGAVGAVMLASTVLTIARIQGSERINQRSMQVEASASASLSLMLLMVDCQTMFP